MKKIFLTILSFCMLIFLSSCGNSNKGETVTLPIKGHFSVMGDIIIETDVTSVINEVIPNAKAFTYEDGKFYELKRYETEIFLPEEVTAYEEELNIPLQYFICNKTVYAYPNTEKKRLGTTVDTYSIPNDENGILVEAGAISNPVYVNLKNRKTTELCDKNKIGSDYYASIKCISDDGQYAAVGVTASDDRISENYIIDLDNFKTTKVPLPAYDPSAYEYKNSFAVCFAEDRLYVNYTLNELDIDGGVKVGTFFYDVKKKRSEELAAPLTDYTGSEQYPYIQMKFEQETGTLKIKNLKSITDYSFSVYPSNGLWGVPNKTGQYFIGSYFDMPVAGYDENGQPYYENDPQNSKYITIDAKNQKRIDLTKADDNFNYTTYNGMACGYEWISETELLITCHDGEQEYIQSVINIKDVSK